MPFLHTELKRRKENLAWSSATQITKSDFKKPQTLCQESKSNLCIPAFVNGYWSKHLYSLTIAPHHVISFPHSLTQETLTNRFTQRIQPSQLESDLPNLTFLSPYTLRNWRRSPSVSYIQWVLDPFVHNFSGNGRKLDKLDLIFWVERVKIFDEVKMMKLVAEFKELNL